MEIITHLLDDEVCSLLHLALGSIGEHDPEDILTGREQKEWSVFTNIKRRREYISTRFLIKELGSYVGLDPERIETKKDKMGKPFVLHEGKRLFMSIAHTDKKILCAMSGQADIGVDIEPVGRTVSPRLRERILHPTEKKQLEHVESVQLWTVKEAAVKLLGSGLRTNLNDLTVRPAGERNFLARFNDDKTARICSFQHQGYWISIAYFV